MGRQADALDAYQSARRTFLDELGLELGPELQALNRAVLKQDPSLDAPQAPSAPARRTLPSPPTPLIGRERAVATALTLLRGDVRLLTLTGPGGTGKTRLALALAQALEEELEGGTAFVELAAATDSQTALATVAQALGVEERDDHPLLDAIGDALTGEEVLLVLDNFEQVRDAAPEVARLLASAPRLKVLVTSRATLHLSGEHEFAVPPLDLPDTALAADPGALAQSSAVALFVHRAQAVQPDFVLDAANGPAVAELCHRLDGLPLALELAAARTKLLAPDALLARLTEQLDDLGAGAVDLPERQRTLRATIAWSCGLLPEGGRRLFARLGVFPGGCTFDAAEHVCDGDLESIEVLLDNSLVSVHDGRGESRLTMLETIRAFAVEQLETTGEAESMRRRLARYLAEKAARAEAELPGEAQAVWLAQLEADKENVRAALTWALQHEPDTALRIAACLRVFWYLHGYSAEGRRWIEAALAASTSTEPSMRAKALTTLGTFAEHQGDFQQARVLQEEAVALLRDLEEAPAPAAALNNLGVVAVQQADYELARVAFEESIEIKRGLDNRRAIAPSLSNLGTVAMKQGDIARARGLHEEAIDLMRELGIAGGVVMANSLSTLAEVALAEENVHEARRLVGEALLVRNELGDKGGAADSLLVLARVEAAYGRLREAERAVQESLALAEELQDKEGLAAALEVASDHVVKRDPARAVALRAAASRLRAEIGAPLAVLDRDRGERTLAAARDALGDDLYAGSFAEGEKLSTPQAVELAREPAALVGGD